MERRDFLKLAATTGVALVAPSAFASRARATGPYAGPYFLLIHADGGWDPTLLCDPKGSDGPTPDINKTFTRAQIGKTGPISYAPLAGTPSGMAYTAQAFFQKYQSRLYILNGVDTTTANHDTGTRFVWSGQTRDGFPSFAAVVAAGRTPGNPSSTWNRIAQMQRERLDDLQQRQTLPRLGNSTSTLYMTRSADHTLPQLAAALPSQTQINAANAEQSGLYSQGLIAIAGFKTGLAVSASISPHLGFDTHANHDGTHQPNMLSLLYGIDQVMQELVKQGLDNKVVVVIGSDFGRTPVYNAGNGKDHWNITSMMFMGPGITGNRVVGSTDDSCHANAVNPGTLANDPGGIRIRCDHVHKALRKLAGVADSDGANKFPLDTAEDMPLFI